MGKAFGINLTSTEIFIRKIKALIRSGIYDFILNMDDTCFSFEETTTKPFILTMKARRNKKETKIIQIKK